jgi:hypothetical protein
VDATAERGRPTLYGAAAALKSSATETRTVSPTGGLGKAQRSMARAAFLPAGAGPT